jgi:cell division inhibitor SulA
MDNMLKQTVESLLEHPQLWRGARRSAPHVIASGHAELDASLSGGWPGGALTEILLPQPGIGELELVLPALLRLGRERRWIALIGAPYTHRSPAWQNSGMNLSRLLWVHPRSARERLLAMEQAMRNGTCGGVLGWSDGSFGTRELRRLQLAAEHGNCMGILFNVQTKAGQMSPAALRLRLECNDEPEDESLTIHLAKGVRSQMVKIPKLMP